MAFEKQEDRPLEGWQIKEFTILTAQALNLAQESLGDTTEINEEVLQERARVFVKILLSLRADVGLRLIFKNYIQNQE